MHAAQVNIVQLSRSGVSLKTPGLLARKETCRIGTDSPGKMDPALPHGRQNRWNNIGFGHVALPHTVEATGSNPVPPIDSEAVTLCGASWQLARSKRASWQLAPHSVVACKTHIAIRSWNSSPICPTTHNRNNSDCFPDPDRPLSPAPDAILGRFPPVAGCVMPTTARP